MALSVPEIPPGDEEDRRGSGCIRKDDIGHDDQPRIGHHRVQCLGCDLDGRAPEAAEHVLRRHEIERGHARVGQHDDLLVPGPVGWPDGHVVNRVGQLGAHRPFWQRHLRGSRSWPEPKRAKGSHEREHATVDH
jgi:hypothetical protein